MKIFTAIAATAAFLILGQTTAFAPSQTLHPKPCQSRPSSPHRHSVFLSMSMPTPPKMPTHSPATSLPNQIYNWRGYQTRYQVSGPPDADHTVLLVHGLFVNSDHWRKMLTGLNDNITENHTKTCRVYALDLLGSGWSDKPSRNNPMAQSISGENGRFVNCNSICYRDAQSSSNTTKKRPRKLRSDATLKNIPLGTPAGGNRVAPSLDLRHPLRSPYNFYTWAEQITDFVHDVIYAESHSPPVTLVANSIGTMSALQSVLDEPNLFNGVLVINPNFRELHMAEVPLSALTMPIVRRIQSLLRDNGHGLFKTLATPETVTQILKEPYAVTDAIDEELVSVLLDPLLTPGADEVVFDTLSYSAGPLPEQQLSSSQFPDLPVWVIYGKDDPWTPARRVEKLRDVGRPGEGGSTVERVVGLDGVGHCPHDERPEVVNGLVWEFLERLASRS
jgi:pimeloyl-ACP methyl ester carboxylesterase